MTTQQTINKKQAYEQKVKAQLDQWDAKIEELKTKAAQKNAEVRVQYDHQIQEFQSKRDEVQKKLHHLQQSSEDAWEEISQGIETAWHELGKSFESAVSKFQ